MNRAPSRQSEVHRSSRSKWLRAAVLGADDGLVSTASLMLGVAAASASKPAVLIAGVAGLVAGAMSMAAGEYVSVSAQRDSEQADIAVEEQELADAPHAELNELTMIYVKRGLETDLAIKVAHGEAIGAGYAARHHLPRVISGRCMSRNLSTLSTLGD